MSSKIDRLQIFFANLEKFGYNVDKVIGRLSELDHLVKVTQKCATVRATWRTRN